MSTMPMAMQDILHVAQSRRSAVTAVQSYLAFPEFNNVPPAFNRLAHTDFAALSEADENLEWEDYCSAYALGLLTFESYCCGSSTHSESELRSQWDALRGASRLDWEHARAIIARSWNALVRLQHAG